VFSAWRIKGTLGIEKDNANWIAILIVLDWCKKSLLDEELCFVKESFGTYCIFYTQVCEEYKMEGNL